MVEIVSVSNPLITVCAPAGSLCISFVEGVRDACSHGTWVCTRRFHSHLSQLCVQPCVLLQRNPTGARPPALRSHVVPAGSYSHPLLCQLCAATCALAGLCDRRLLLAPASPALCSHMCALAGSCSDSLCQLCAATCASAGSYSHPPGNSAEPCVHSPQAPTRICPPAPRSHVSTTRRLPLASPC